MRKWIVALIVLFAFIGLVAVFRFASHRGAVHKRDSLENANDARPVKVQTVVVSEFVDFLEVAGVLSPRSQVTVTSEVSGKVERVFFDLGDEVKKGAVLCRIEAEPYEIALAQADANLLMAKSAYEQAESSYERAKGLREKGLISESEWERVESGYFSAKGAYEAAEAQKRLAERNLRNTRVRAPISGTISNRAVEVGVLVGPQVPLFEIVDTTKLILKAGLAEDKAALIEQGVGVKVVVDATGDELEGVLARMGLAADQQGMFPVEIEVSGTDGLKSRAGYKARAFIEVARYPETVLIPQSALVQKQDGSFVFVADGDIARLRWVEVALFEGEQAVVSSGLADGDEVIVAGVGNLEDNSKVRRVGE